MTIKCRSNGFCQIVITGIKITRWSCTQVTGMCLLFKWYNNNFNFGPYPDAWHHHLRRKWLLRIRKRASIWIPDTYLNNWQVKICYSTETYFQTTLITDSNKNMFSEMPKSECRKSGKRRNRNKWWFVFQHVRILNVWA